MVADAAELSQLFKGNIFDRIILDAPCSNSGVLRRRVEARYRLKPDDFSYYHSMQLSFLEQCPPLLKPDGIIVYSTCSVDQEENQQVIKAFLKNHSEFKLVDECLTLQSIDGGDGGFMAKLQRV